MHLQFESRKHCSSKTRGEVQSAFSLLELLVVIGIIAILAALILPALLAAKRSAQRATCANNVRQLGLAVQLFATDNHVYPLYVNPGFWEGRYPEHRASWVPATQGILDAKRPHDNKFYLKGIWLCPAAPRPSSYPDGMGFPSYGYNAYGLSKSTKAGAPAIGLGGHYLQNGGSGNLEPPVRDSEIASPSQFMMLGDGFQGGKGTIVDGRLVIRRDDGVEDFLGSTARSRARHKEKANVVFCDGHVEAPSLNYLFEDNTDAGLGHWNRDNLPHRECLIAK